MVDPSLYNETDLFKRIAASDEPAFRRVFELYRSKLYYFVYHILQNEDETKEVVQDIFMRLWASRHTLTTVNNVDAYLFTIARNRSLDYLHKLSNERKMKSEWAQRPEITENSTEDEFDYNQSKRLIEEAIRELPTQQATVFRLSKLEGLKRQEIAERLQISENTVKKHLAEAIKSVRQYLNEHGDTALLLLIWICS